MSTQHPQIGLTNVASSQILGVGHDASTNTLAVQFKNKAGEPTSTYHYANVEADFFRELLGAESVYKHFAAHIKSAPDKYPFTKMA